MMTTTEQAPFLVSLDRLPAYLDDSVTELELNSRVANTLRHLRCRFIWQILVHSEAQIVSMKDIGPFSLKNLREALTTKYGEGAKFGALAVPILRKAAYEIRAEERELKDPWVPLWEYLGLTEQDREFVHHRSWCDEIDRAIALHGLRRGMGAAEIFVAKKTRSHGELIELARRIDESSMLSPGALEWCREVGCHRSVANLVVALEVIVDCPWRGELREYLENLRVSPNPRFTTAEWCDVRRYNAQTYDE